MVVHHNQVIPGPGFVVGLEGVWIAVVTGDVNTGVSVDELVLVGIGTSLLVLSEVPTVVMEVKAETTVELKTIGIMRELRGSLRVTACNQIIYELL